MPTPNPASPERLRLAVLADIHGNDWALAAVIADAARHCPDRWVLLGDLLADGPAPVRTLDRIRSLPDPVLVRGNTDRYLADLRRVVAPRVDMPDLMATWRWAEAQLGAPGCHFLADLPVDALLETPAGRVLATHGRPGDDEGFVWPDRPATWAGLDGHGARLLLVAHTHTPFVIETGAITVINPGSVGLPEPTGWRASYALVDLLTGGQIVVRHVQVDWDVDTYVAGFEEGIPINRKSQPMLDVLRRRTVR
jgi:putative phosphoesterase